MSTITKFAKLIVSLSFAVLQPVTYLMFQINKFKVVKW